MSIENNLAVIAKSLERIATAMEKGSIADPTPATPQQVLSAVVQAAAVATAPVTEVATPAPATAQPATAMPAAPSFMAPAATPAAAVNAVPFTDGKGLVAYVMDAYKAMGPEKGAGIQNILVGLGYQNINDVKPEHYAALHQAVEALKV